MATKLNGVALSSVAAGSLLMWSGGKGWSLLATLGEIVSGKKPSEPESVTLVSADAASGGTSVGASSSALANLALQYQGHAYLYGGAPGKDGSRPWDCSSFINWIFSVKAGRAIPGYGAGKYDGSSHGPPTGSWGVWNGLTHVSSPEAGDVVVWLNHMGMCIGNGQMISALDSKDGTKVTPIQGYGNGPLLCYGRPK